jgi:hypothetical protein
VVDLQVTRGFRWGISMSRSGESYVSVVTGAELRGRTSERPPEAAPERLGAHRARCGSRRSIRADLRRGQGGDGRRSGAPFGARAGAAGGTHNSGYRERFRMPFGRRRRPPAVG